MAVALAEYRSNDRCQKAHQVSGIPKSVSSSASTISPILADRCLHELKNIFPFILSYLCTRVEELLLVFSVTESLEEEDEVREGIGMNDETKKRSQHGRTEPVDDHSLLQFLVSEQKFIVQNIFRHFCTAFFAGKERAVVPLIL